MVFHSRGLLGEKAFLGSEPHGVRRAFTDAESRSEAIPVCTAHDLFIDHDSGQ